MVNVVIARGLLMASGEELDNLPDQFHDYVKSQVQSLITAEVFQLYVL